MIVVVCPGQGSQTPGFLAPWLAEPALAEQLAALSRVGRASTWWRTAPSATPTRIRDTAVAQPLIVAAGLLTLGALLADGRASEVGGIAGHSVGEITAAAAAGVLTEDGRDAPRRASAGARWPRPRRSSATGMSAVIGGDEAALLARLAELGLEPANFNGGGQIVVAGALDALAAADGRAARRRPRHPAAGRRRVPHPLHGARRRALSPPSRPTLDARRPGVDRSGPTATAAS